MTYHVERVSGNDTHHLQNLIDGVRERAVGRPQGTKVRVEGHLEADVLYEEEGVHVYDSVGPVENHVTFDKKHRKAMYLDTCTCIYSPVTHIVNFQN